jgi:Protein of unknown function (DUF1168)
MSEPGPESIPTSTSQLTGRATKKRALTPVSAQAANVEALFANPSKAAALTPGSNAKTLAAPPEIVTNVQGSSAGAGSGEFHVYKASRRREYERMRLMDEEVLKEKEEQEWKGKREEVKKRDEAKTNKNKAKREKAKARKEKSKGSGEMDHTEKTTKSLKPMVKARAITDDDDDDDDDASAPAVKAVEEIGIVIHDDG